jgi:hypothetical protein
MDLARRLRELGSSGGYAAPMPSGTPTVGAVRLGRQATSMANANPSLRASIEAIAKQGKQSQDKGLLAGIFNNPLAKITLKGLEAFTIPGRAVVAGIREGIDSFDGDPNTEASFGDFVRNVKDPMYGFGKAFKINTGNKWLDRAIGFVGDVALDPITYATFGVGKAVGFAGRADLAAKVLANTGDKALSTAVVRQGRSALRGLPNANDVLQSVGANKYGVYWFSIIYQHGNSHC